MGPRDRGNVLRCTGSNDFPAPGPSFRTEIDNMIRLYGKKAGLSLSSHSLRRACATHMLLNGAHPEQIRALLGHSRFGSLNHYLKVTINEVKKMHKRSKPGK